MSVGEFWIAPHMKLLEFIVASSLLTLMPGPDILFVMAQSIVQGRKTGIAVALGLCSGLFVHTALAALGISLIIASSPILFAAIRYAGIAYLIYMGIVSLRSRNDASVSIADSTATLQNESAGTFGKLYRTGITMNLLNPKIILFFLAFFPQFLDKTSATPRIDILILGTTFAAVAITIFTIVALVADWVSARFGARQIPPATLAWIRAGVYWTIAMLFLFY